MLRFYDVDISEPMALGLGSGLFFSHMPFITLGGIAVTSFRPLPGHIFKLVMKRLKIKVKSKRFLNPDKSMRALDALLKQGKPVGTVVGVFYLPYFPKEYRFHFNAHNLCVFGKEDDKYIVSDPVVIKPEELTYDEFKRVRYAEGTYPPYGKMYWISKLPDEKVDLKKAVYKAVNLNCKRMLDIPVPFFGVKGIKLLASRMRKWEKKSGEKKALLNLAQVIRMLEEIGTGGAGFRFMYAAFLQQAADVTGNDELKKISNEMTTAGDMWRGFSFEAARKFKNRSGDTLSYDQLADKLIEISEKETSIFLKLRTVSESNL